ncbi:MAG: hypothetical protein EOO61_03435 [Hymenobacter sp.]|nr:MAG: hypothetical protein EOO61_03435 [Hymenobacter sp.]
MSTTGGKIIRDGNVAVLVSPGYGAGWSTWGAVSVFDPELVEAVERGDTPQQLVDLAASLYPDEYVGGAEDLVVRWLPEGTLFRIEEYDGSESLEFAGDVQWMEA